jgi:predicted acetyltransferase
MVKLQLLNLSGPLPTATYEVQVDDRAVGKIQLRHRPSQSEGMPDGFESHVFYEINSDQRGRGYATEALRIVMKDARELKMTVLTLTIAEDNVASQKVAEANGGEIVDKKPSIDGKEYFKYLIKL